MASEEIHYDPGRPTMYKLSSENQSKAVSVLFQSSGRHYCFAQLQFHSFNLVTERVSTQSWEELQLDRQKNSNLITEVLP